VIVAPPLDAGADQVRLTEPLPAVGALRVGGPGGTGDAAGVADRSFDCVPVPALLIAATL
jgi:hypothetical protein